METDLTQTVETLNEIVSVIKGIGGVLIYLALIVTLIFWKQD